MVAGSSATRGRRRIFTIVTPLLAILVVDGALSAVLRLGGGRFAGREVPPYDLVFGPSQAESLEKGERGTYFRFDPDLGWSIRPNGASEDGLFRANAAGFRANRDYDLVPPSSVTRLAVFGDSFVHGDKVTNDETWAQRLEASAPNVEVLNFGVNGYGTDQALLRFRRDGVPYHPHVVVIGYMPENILRNVSVYRPAYKHESASIVVKPRFRLDEGGATVLVAMPVASQRELAARVRDRSLVATLLETDYWVRRAPLAYTGSPIFASSLARVLYGRFEEAGRSRPPHYRNVRAEPFRVTLEILRTFAREARARGARRAIVVLLPGQEAIEEESRGRARSWATLPDSLRAAGVEVLDVTPALLAELGTAEPASRFRDYHYDPRANEVVAAAIAEGLVRAPVRP